MLAFLIHSVPPMLLEELMMILVDIAKNTEKDVLLIKLMLPVGTFSLNKTRKLQAERRRYALIRKIIVKTKL